MAVVTKTDLLWLLNGTLRSSSVRDGRRIILVDLVHDQPLVDDRRRGDVT